jgi:hypothetical protein
MSLMTLDEAVERLRWITARHNALSQRIDNEAPPDLPDDSYSRRLVGAISGSKLEEAIVTDKEAIVLLHQVLGMRHQWSDVAWVVEQADAIWVLEKALEISHLEMEFLRHERGE